MSSVAGSRSPCSIVLMRRFRDRRDAGAQLAEELAGTIGTISAPVVLGVPRGGVVVAEVVAVRLGAELDVLGVEKIGAPWNPELAVGAVGEGDALWIDKQLVAGIDPKALELSIQRERAELEQKLAGVRAVWPRVDLTGRTVIVVDDGIATGSTVRAGLMALERAMPARRILAVPVGPPETLAKLELIADSVVCPLRPVGFSAVGQWYEVFDQTPQGEVITIFERRRAANASRS